MSGEKTPKPEFQHFDLAPDQVRTLLKSELRTIRMTQMRTHYARNANLIHGDIIRVLLVMENWKPSPGLPIEVSQTHSLVLQEAKQVNNKPRTRLHSLVCRVRNVVCNHCSLP